MDRKNLILAHLAVFSANLIYGLNYVIAKGIMPDYLQPRPIILLRVGVSTLFFFLISNFVKKEKIEHKDMGRMAIAAFFGVALNQIMFFEGLNLTTPINASIIMVMVPIAVLVFSHFLIQDRISLQKLIGIGLGTTGAAYLILGKGNISLDSDHFIGNLLIVVNASSYAFFLVLIKPVMHKYHPLSVMKWVFLFGLIYILPFTIPPSLKANWTEIPLNIWLSIGYVIVFTTMLAYFFNNYSLKRLSPTINSAYIYTQPVFATLVALFTATDKLTIIELIAALLIFSGVYIVNRRKPMIRLKASN